MIPARWCATKTRAAVRASDGRLLGFSAELIGGPFRFWLALDAAGRPIARPQQVGPPVPFVFDAEPEAVELVRARAAAR